MVLFFFSLLFFFLFLGPPRSRRRTKRDTFFFFSFSFCYFGLLFHATMFKHTPQDSQKQQEMEKRAGGTGKHTHILGFFLYNSLLLLRSPLLLSSIFFDTFIFDSPLPSAPQTRKASTRTLPPDRFIMVSFPPTIDLYVCLLLLSITPFCSFSSLVFLLLHYKYSFGGGDVQEENKNKKKHTRPLKK